MTPDEVKTARRMIGVSQGALATALGVSVSLVGHWETGRAKIQDEPAGKLRRMAIDGGLTSIKEARPNAGVGGYSTKAPAAPVAASKQARQGPGSTSQWPGFYSERGGTFDAYLWRMFP